MFVPAQFRPRDPAWVAELIQGNPLATLVTNGPDGWPVATHVPTIPDRDTDAPDLVGGMLLGHLNRCNPHWELVRRGGPATLIYQGPHGYVSPTVYQTTPAAPTWDFTAVHVRGLLTAITDRGQTLDVVRRTVARYERDLGTCWDMTGSLGYFDRLLPGVGAFRLEVERVDAIFKLSQEQPAEVRDRIIGAFTSSGSPEYRRLAALIRRAQP